MITAHAGSDGLGDNSLLFIETMLDQAVEAFEVDCQLSNQGDFYLSHDEVDHHEDLLSLEEVFALMAYHGNITTIINVDCKQAGMGSKVLDLARRYKILDRVVLSGEYQLDDFNKDERSHLFYNLENQIDVASWPLTDQELKVVLEEIAASGVEVIQSYYKLVTPEILQMVQDAHLKLSVWTVDDFELIDDFLHRGVYNVTTNRALAYLQIDSF